MRGVCESKTYVRLETVTMCFVRQVADDGYGVSYVFAGEDIMFFHISSKKASPETVSNVTITKQLPFSHVDIHFIFIETFESKKLQTRHANSNLVYMYEYFANV